MAVFEYKGLNRSGSNVRGSIDSDNARTARARLKKDGIFVVDLKDKRKARYRADSAEVQNFYRVNSYPVR